MDQELTSMKITKQERKENTSPVPTEVGMNGGPQYPWGLQVNLDDASLKKMGVSLADYAVDDVVELYARCKVTRLSQSAREGGEKDRTMELQITDMCLEAADMEADKEKADEDMGWDEDEQSVTSKLKKKGY